MAIKNRGAALTVVGSPVSDPKPTTSFCSHCGTQPGAQADSRVCADCGLGLILHTDVDSAPAPGAPFIVLDGSLSVCAVSQAAEGLLATTETQAVNRHVTEL